MKNLCSPQNEIELTIIRSLLDAEGIPHFVHNDHFGTMRTGPRIDLLNRKTIQVAARDEDRARQILQDYLHNKKAQQPVAASEHSPWDKLRMVIEILLFGWFIPGNRWPKRKPWQSED